MKIFEGQLTKDFLQKNKIVFMPQTGAEAVRIISALRTMGFDCGVFGDINIGDAVQGGIAMRKGKIVVKKEDSIEMSFSLNPDTYFAEVRHLIPDYVDPVTAQFNAMAKKMDEMQRKIELLEERVGPQPARMKIIN